MVKGYKVFNPDWTCRDFQYEVGKRYKMDDKPVLCNTGFHFCENLADCFGYYKFDCNNKVAEVIAHGDIDRRDDENKSCTNEIEIVRELSWQEVLTLVNIGKSCTGLSNSGDWNSGNRNSGNCNSGDWNSGDSNSGCFNTRSDNKIYLFDKISDWSMSDWNSSRARNILYDMPTNLKWLDEDELTDEQREQTPQGRLVKIPDEELKQARQEWWDKLNENDKECVKSIPNFDAEKFEICTMIKVD